jgi:hypothetical protein
MASTYSSLKIELIGTGEQAGAWGATTNTNLGTAIEQAITGSVSVAFASADVTLTLTDTNVAQNARALRLDLVGTSGGARNLFVPAIAKQYIVNNGLADTVTIKNATGTGIAIPSGRTMIVFNNATNVVDVTTYATSLTLGAALPVSSGGTGQTSYTDGQLLIGNSTGNTLAKSTLTAGSGISITNGSGAITIAATGGGGTVTTVSVATANGFAGTVANATSTPAITLSTSITGVLKGNGTAISAAVAGTDYVTPTGSETLTNKTLTNPTVTNYTETRFTANSSTAITLDLANGTMQDITLTGTATITMPTATAGKSFILLLRSGAGGYTVTWTTVKWPNNSAPTITATASRLDMYSFFSDGTNWYGVTVSQNYTP